MHDSRETCHYKQNDDTLAVENTIKISFDKKTSKSITN